MFAIIEIKGKQHKVKEGDLIDIGLDDKEVGKTFKIDNIYLIDDGQKVVIGEPIVEGYQVVAKVVSHNPGDKIYVRRFKSKVRHRRKIGFRPQLTQLEIQKISKA